MAKLLVSDDEPQVLELVTLVLEAEGHDVIATSDPREVCALAQMGVDAIVLDVNMPVSGFEVLGELRRDPATAELPILFLSGLADGSHRARGLREGADDYMVKPFEPSELVIRIERLLEWRAERLARRAPAEEPEAGNGVRRFGRYEVLEVIGQGSMGTVYRGRDPRLERPVALKTIRLEAVATESQRQEMLDRLQHEAITVARFSHPNIIAIYDMGDVRDSAFIAMELVDGVSLRDHLLGHGPLAAEQLIPLASAVAQGLAIAHAQEVIHRDVKPGNILLGRDGGIKVSDFGLAFVVSAMKEDSTEISGTPGYVPPEVMNQQPYTEPGDLFGLGASLYEGLTGVHPLAGETLRDTILNTIHGNIRPLRERLPNVLPELEELVRALLSLDPHKRPTAAEAADRLEGLAAARRWRWRPPESAPEG